MSFDFLYFVLDRSIFTVLVVRVRVGIGGLSGGERLNGIVCHTVALSFPACQNMEQHMLNFIFLYFFLSFHLYFVSCIS